MTGTSVRYVIVNADDFGSSEGINRGIIEAHETGIVTSASLMVNAPATEAAVELARDHQALSLGLHVNFTGEGEEIVDLRDLQAVKSGLEAQFSRFLELTGQRPTHIDSHHHIHREFNVGHLFMELGRRHGLPLRGYSDVMYVGGFYGQWEHGQSDETHINVESLVSLLRSVKPGFTEIACHPGYVTGGFVSVYNREREIELKSLTDPRAKAAIEEEDIELVNYGDYLKRAKPSKPRSSTYAGRNVQK